MSYQGVLSTDMCRTIAAEDKRVGNVVKVNQMNKPLRYIIYIYTHVPEHNKHSLNNYIVRYCGVGKTINQCLHKYNVELYNK